MEDSSDGNPVIETKKLVKKYSDKVTAIDGIDLSIANNSIFALLGPNGAGKTTTVSILTTMAKPSAGSASVNGYDTVKQAKLVRHNIGVTFQESQRDQYSAGFPVQSIFGVVQTYLFEGFSNNFWDVNITFGSNLTRDYNASLHNQSFGVNSCFRVLAYNGIQNAVGDLIRHLVRVTFSNGF